MTMTRRLALVAVASTLLMGTGEAAAQNSTEDIRDEIMGHFEASVGKVAALAEKMPEPLYGWSPGDGVMTVGHVYAHITHYNFMYLRDNLGIPAPADVDVDGIEDIRDKGQVLALLEQSIAHVKHEVGAMTGHALGSSTTLYGRQVPQWAVLMQLVAHMNEHLGQSIAYARMNDVTPPWSR